MIKIKLTRLGRRGRPFFRIVAKEARSKRDGKFLDLLGYYDPQKVPFEVWIDQEKYLNWIKKGAKPTETVANLVKKIKSKS